MKINILKDLEKLKNYSEELLYSEDSKRAYNLIIFLQKELKNKKVDVNLLEDYERLILKLKWVCLDRFSNKEITGLIEKYFISTYRVNDTYDIWQHLKQKLIQEMDLGKRDVTKLQFQNALEANNEVITNNSNIKRVNEWVKEYIISIGGVATGQLEKIDFFQKNKNFQALNDEDRLKVRKLLNFYGRLKFSSKSIAGIEEEIVVPAEEMVNSYVKDGKIISPKKRDELGTLIDKLFSQRTNKAAETKRRGNASPLRETAKEKVEEQGNALLPQENELVDLQNEASQYPEGGLERKAIEEEIRKISNS